MNNKVKAAVIGGVVLGLLSAIPFVNWLNFCCCLWAIIGGLLASYLYIKNSAVPASAGDGAILGAMAGAIGAVIFLIVGIPLSIVAQGAVQALMISLMESADPSQAELVRRQFAASGAGISGVIIQSLIGAVLLFVFSVLGGLIGIPIFEKRKVGPMPPPPPAGGPYAA
ncbi:MAG TPA: hypothetical protein VJS17_03570 [Pyrinomonadaceae bacterium]|nr:hypothetical protein [Pyrinomonadaceae bacterium]